MNRRSILGLIGAAPLAGNAIGDRLKSVAGNVDPVMSGQFSGGAAKMPNGSYPASNQPLMDHKSAIRTILGDPRAMAEIKEDIQRELRVVHTIDPDLMVIKSFSDMAKITFQRQRNVEQAIAEIGECGKRNNPRQYMHAIARRIDKLMWDR